ncbi:MAG: ATP-binding cassette domain-containing protein [Lachnospiraceae bacterium]|nr:ATP-binding cassette domain-containing protein [Lachnospiraceae bacterium]
MSFLEIQEVSKSYRSRKGRQTEAVQKVSLSLERGRCLGVVGESGCGKSTLCRMIAGVVRPDSGEIWLEGSSVREKKNRKKIQMVFQNSLDAVNLHLNAGRILSEPLENFFSMSREERRNKTEGLLELVGLSKEDAGKYPKQFSGGQLQRICIARALAAEPELLLLDEPLSSLDVSVQAQLLNLLADLKREFRLTGILVSHDLEAVYYLADELAVMYSGALVETLSDITALDCLRHPYARRLLSVHNGEAGTEQAEGKSLPEERGEACVYASQCPKADGLCFSKSPELSEREDGHKIACHYI